MTRARSPRELVGLHNERHTNDAARVDARATGRASLPGFPFEARERPLAPWRSMKAPARVVSACALLLVSLETASLAAPPPSYSLAQWQTAYQDQGPRGTCYAFAGAAALEAKYQRDFGIVLDLSEQYIFALRRSMVLLADYPAKSNIDNISSYHQNGGASDIAGLLTLFYAPLETDAPYISDRDALLKSIPAAGKLQTQEEIDYYEYSPLNVPLAARTRAHYGVTSYGSVRNKTNDATFTDDLEKTISHDQEVLIDIDTYWKFDNAKNMYVYDANAKKPGFHTTLLIGYDHNAGYFEAKNSWGEGAPIHISYDFLQRQASGGTYLTGVVDPNADDQSRAFWLGKWNLDVDGVRGQLVIHRFVHLESKTPDEITLLGSYYDFQGNRYDVNGRVFEAGFMQFYIAKTTARGTPGTVTDPMYTVYLVRNGSNTYAAGLVDRNGTWVGVAMSRDLELATPSTGSYPTRMEGTYKMRWNGSVGTLTIGKFSGTSFTGTYTSKGVNKVISGSYDPSVPNRLMFDLVFTTGSKPHYHFTLRAHGQEDGVLSGYLSWSEGTDTHFGGVVAYSAD